MDLLFKRSRHLSHFEINRENSVMFNQEGFITKVYNTPVFVTPLIPKDVICAVYGMTVLAHIRGTVMEVHEGGVDGCNECVVMDLLDA
jgi:hypothetical protein